MRPLKAIRAALRRPPLPAPDPVHRDEGGETLRALYACYTSDPIYGDAFRVAHRRVPPCR